MRKRVRAVHARAAILRSEFRQRNLAKGTWMRLRRELALSERAFALTPDAASRLEALGVSPLPFGEALHPKRYFYRLDAQTLDTLGGELVELTVRLDAEMLATEAIGLLPFEEE